MLSLVFLRWVLLEKMRKLFNANVGDRFGLRMVESTQDKEFLKEVEGEGVKKEKETAIRY